MPADPSQAELATRKQREEGADAAAIASDVTGFSRTLASSCASIPWHCREGVKRSFALRAQLLDALGGARGSAIAMFTGLANCLVLVDISFQLPDVGFEVRLARVSLAVFPRRLPLLNSL